MVHLEMADFRLHSGIWKEIVIFTNIYSWNLLLFEFCPSSSV